LDLSKVLFVCSANLLDTIIPALYDRMETIELSGYTAVEKKQIAANYLLPKSMEKTGLQEYNVKFTDASIEKLIVGWAREAGVRSLNKLVNRICEKICLKIVKETPGYNAESEIVIEADQLKDYVGIPIFGKAKLYNVLPEGISVGLGYNAIGGSILFIECVKNSFRQIKNTLEQSQGNGSLGNYFFSKGKSNSE
jgi:ATP-dependent Lon protease